MFRQLRQRTGGTAPILVQVNFHSDTATRMAAIIARYLDDDPKPLADLPLADISGASGASAGGKA